MVVYLLRHGKAGRSDPDKPLALTSQGKAEVTALAEHFKRNRFKVDTLWHSPKTRAVQTTQILLKVLEDESIAVEEKAGLIPDGDAQDIYREISGQREKNLLVVTHLPLIEELAALFSADSPQNLPFSFPTAGVAAFERKNGIWKRLWALDPDKLR